ncbi:Rho guanyl nucleotide exchange factor [Aspergillus avenaceus]|uniref:Dynamin-binding protein n=1 Tax=Aspergillus avenaceus TaxID=36643 RepID=A0A5N6U2F2_ASPAV|nr:Rho guanyl nucleotide exchange factor [Aspergillus avenaceus]
MSGSDVEHVSCFIDSNPRELRRQYSPTINEAFNDSPTDISLESSLIALPSAAPPLARTTHSAQSGPTDSLGFPVTAGLASNDRPSPDPDDYYRPHPLKFAAKDDAGSTDGNLKPETLDSHVAGGRPIEFQRVSSVPTHPLEPSTESLGQYRSASDSSYRELGSGPFRGVAPARASIARGRQVSFKDLVNKFNNNSDQVLPLPSASTSKTVSPSSPADGSNLSKAPSRLGENRDQLRKRNNLSRLNSPGKSGSDQASEIVLPRLRTNQVKDECPEDSNAPNYRRASGGLLSVDTSFRDSGYGNLSYMRRRGSEGTIPSPNPALLDHSELSPGVTPLTPTAWYLGRTPFLEAVNTSTNTNSHRRARSDLAGNWSGVVAVNAPDPPMEVSAPLQPHAGTSLENPPSPHSKSRIPISSRRLNSSSVSGDSSPSSPTARAELTFGNRPTAQVSLPPKGVSRLPKPSPKQSPNRSHHSTHDGEATFAMNPHARREMASARSRQHGPDKGALLEAYIAAPPPKKSPPLRSSRPRQPVTHTGPSTPRSKVVETVSTFQQHLNSGRDLRSSRPRERRVPELGTVDFATRRQRIQQAFNRTVQENERKEEKAAELRRQVKAHESIQQQDQFAAPEQLIGQTEVADPVVPTQSEDTATVIDDFVDTGHDTQDMTTEAEVSRSPPQLQVRTDVPVSINSRTAAEYHPMTMDSPTLGHPEIILSGQSADTDRESCYIPPASAITIESDETHTTAFDTEPQAELSRQNVHASHRTLLSQIMRIRDSSPSSSSCDENDYGFSDTDEKESIPIVLRDALGLENSNDSCENDEHNDLYIKRSPPNNKHINRWSMSSWSSSLHHEHSSDGQCEGSEDDLSHIQQCTDDSEGATTQSCSASSTTPSITGHPPTLVSQKASVLQDKGSGETNRTAYGNLDAPSLVRLAGWDSKRVAQLYMKEIASGRGHNLPMPAIRASPEQLPAQNDKKEDGTTDALTDDPVLIPRPEKETSSERVRPSASLFWPDDWEHASPSIMDWMQVAADEGSAPQGSTNEGGPKHDGIPTPRVVTSTPQGAPAEGDKGLGLAINVQPPQDLDTEEDRPPPLPRHDPPPPPDEPRGDANVIPPQAPLTTKSSELSLNIFTNAIFAPLGPVQTDSSEDSSLRRLEPVPSPGALDSSTTSLVPSTLEQARPGAISPSPEQRRLKKRRHVIKELVDTEYTFGRDMKVVDDIYKGTSSSCLDLSADDVKVLFANSDQVVQFSMTFQDTLKEAAKSVYIMPKRWLSKRSARNPVPKADRDSSAGTAVSDADKDNTTFIGQAFLAHIATMEKVYADYLKNHDAANKKLQALQKNPKVAIWLKECRDWASDLTTAWDLDSLLVKPVQRILKYPLLLGELLDSTPKDHPDHSALMSALEEVTNISVRINELKKRADVVGQVVGRKRKESDVRTGLSKAFGRRTEKLKQQVGLSELVQDPEYDSLSQRFGDNYFQLQVVMRDAEMYTHEVQGSMDRFSEITAAIEGFIEAYPTSYSELESKWHELKMAVQETTTDELPKHIAAVRKSVIDPMVTLLKLHDGPQKVMKKRDKRLMDYARFKSIRERGDKPDKKTTEQGEQFVALNEALKDELPKLYSLTAQLMEACLKSFVHIQTTWFSVLQERLRPLVDSFPDDLEKVVGDWTSAFNATHAQVLSLGVCNGSLLAEAVNLVNFNTPPINSPRRPSTVNSVSTRVGSTLDESPKASNDFGSGNHPFQSPSFDSQSQISYGRKRADSAISGRVVPEATELPRSQILQQITTTSSTSVLSSNTNRESCPSLPRLSLDSPFLVDVIGPSESEDKPSEERPASPGGRYSGFFSSAMPMSDNPQDNAPTEDRAPKDPAVLFLAASVYEFNIDRARREAGYPYLTYVAGEIFDVIAEKGELWLAKNQDDPTHQVGWIWNKHFAKLST